MNKRKLQLGDLDRIGKKLIGQDVTSENDIDKIVNSPFLYSIVRSRILADAASTGTRFGFARYFVFAGSSLVIVFGVFATFSYFRMKQEPVATVEQPKIIQIQRSNVPDGIASEREEQLPVDPLVERVNTKRRVSQQAQTIDYRKPGSRSAKRETTARQPTLEFHPIAFTGDASDIVGGRVVRVELSRQSLFAMGVNIPLENGVENVKADLLIGPDGVTRAVRLARDF